MPSYSRLINSGAAYFQPANLLKAARTSRPNKIANFFFTFLSKNYRFFLYPRSFGSCSFKSTLKLLLVWEKVQAPGSCRLRTGVLYET